MLKVLATVGMVMCCGSLAAQDTPPGLSPEVLEMLRWHNPDRQRAKAIEQREEMRRRAEERARELTKSKESPQ